MDRVPFGARDSLLHYQQRITTAFADISDIHNYQDDGASFPVVLTTLEKVLERCDKRFQIYSRPLLQ